MTLEDEQHYKDILDDTLQALKKYKKNTLFNNFKSLE